MDKIIVKILSFFHIVPIVILTDDEEFAWESAVADTLWGCDCLPCRQAVRRGGWLADRSEK